MVEVSLEALVMGNIPGMTIMALKPVDSQADDRVLPICIGPVEAAAIGRALGKEANPRPMTHSLVGTIVAQLGGQFQKVLIDKVKGTVFYATLFIKRGTEVIKIDARPSDAIALALRNEAPIFVTDDVLDAASFPSWINAQREINEVQIQEFHRFVEDINPEDFCL